MYLVTAYSTKKRRELEGKLKESLAQLRVAQERDRIARDLHDGVGAQLREQLAQEGLKVGIEVRDVLTPEQLTKAAEIKDRIRALRTEMRGLFRDKR